MNFRLLKRISLWFIGVVCLLFLTTLLIIGLKQEAIVDSQIESLNEGFAGKISVEQVHLAPFKNFPHFSLKIDSVQLFEDKSPEAPLILSVADIYLGFNILDLIRGNLDIQSLVIDDGFFDLLIHEDGQTNLEKALAGYEEKKEDGEALEIHLKKLELNRLDLHQRKETSALDIETYIYSAKGGINTKNKQIAAHVDTEFELNIIEDGDTTYFKNKHFEFHTDLNFDEVSGMLTFEPSGIKMEHGDFEVEGSIATKNEMSLDLKLKGSKPSFDMFIAFAPHELIPVLERYDNEGNIYFNASVEGPTTNGRQPFIDVEFGASEAFLENREVKKRIDELGFSGHFTNGTKRNLETMEFSLQNIGASIEKGKMTGDVLVKNFLSPEIEMELNADFRIDFLVDFFNLDEIQDAAGEVGLQLKFHDIVDLEQPEKALEDLNQAYYAELNVRDLAFDSEDLPVPLADLDVHLIMKGKKALLDQFNLKMGVSDLSITGYLSDLPAIVHHTKTPVNAHLEIKSEAIDVAELTEYSESDSTGVDEQIEDLSLAFSFNALGNAFTEFKHLPRGEFFIDDLYADLKHYPHTLHDFHADVIVKDEDLKIIDFTGLIDDSDFHFNGLIHDYSFWMEEALHGDVNLDITLKSDLLRLEDLFSYQGESFVPKDYRHEEIEGLEIHMQTSMLYEQDSLYSIDVQLDKLAGKMHVHPLAFEDFSGKFHYGEDHIMVEKFVGTMGRTSFLMNMNYYLGEDSLARKRDNIFNLSSDFIDFDALSSYSLEEESTSKEEPMEEKTTSDVSAHAEAFNLYELPFTDMQFNLDIGHFIYHRLDLKNIKGQLRSTHNHYLYLDNLNLDAAGGHIAIDGYFNGSDPMNIYLKPKMKVERVDLDKLLFKFENFGQDAVVSENLHGQLYATINGNIRVYPDMVPDLDHSEVHLDVQVLNGRLENYDPVMMLSDYFGDKDLTNIKFDTLQNHMDITNGKITIPNMAIESSLGHLDISGTQDMDDNIDYYARIPWSLIKDAARNKLFGPKSKDKDKEDEIIEVDPKKKTRYLNVNMTGTLDDYKVRMKKAKQP